MVTAPRPRGLAWIGRVRPHPLNLLSRAPAWSGAEHQDAHQGAPGPSHHWRSTCDAL